MKSTIKLFWIPVSLLIIVSACSNKPSPSPSASGGNAQGTATEQAPSGEPFLPFSGLTSIQLLTPSSGAGIKPLFEWSPIDGAAQYSLFLQFSDGQPYWTWTGTSTSIYLGGTDSPPPEDAAGPILEDGMSWSIIALDAQGNIIATSALQLISP